MDAESRDRLTTMEAKLKHNTEALNRLVDTISDLVRYTAQNEHNRTRIERHDDRLNDLERQQGQLKTWIEGRIWAVGALITASILAIEIAVKFL